MLLAEQAPINLAARLIDAHIQGNNGDRTAFEFNGKPYVYSDLAALCNRAGNLLRSLGVRTDDRVAILIPASPSLLACIIGAMKIGATPVVIDAHDAGAIGAGLAPGASVAAVHESRLAQARGALSGIAPQHVLIVGQPVPEYASFVQALRVQPSSLQAQKVMRSATALEIAAGGGTERYTHLDLDALLAADAPPAASHPLIAVLRALARSETALLQAA